MADDIRAISVELQGPAGLLEGLINAKPALTPRAIAVLGASAANRWGHDAYEGVVPRGKGACADRLRCFALQLQGVGRSEGAFADGPGEQADFLAAIDFMTARYAGITRLWAGGMSFGAWVGMTAGAQSPRVTALIGIAPPVTRRDFAPVVVAAKSTFLVHGEMDELIPLREVRKFYSQLSEPKELVVMDAANHLFDGKATEVGEALEDLLRDFDG